MAFLTLNFVLIVRLAELHTWWSMGMGCSGRIPSAVCERAVGDRGRACRVHLLRALTCSTAPLNFTNSRISRWQQLRPDQTWDPSEHGAVFDCTHHILMKLTDVTVMRTKALSGQRTCSRLMAVCKSVANMGCPGPHRTIPFPQGQEDGRQLGEPTMICQVHEEND